MQRFVPQHLFGCIGLKGNEVKVFNGPAAVSSIERVVLTLGHCLFMYRWEGENNLSESEDLQNNSSIELSRIELGTNDSLYIMYALS